MFSDLVQFIRKQFNTNEFIPLHAPIFTGREKEYVLQAIDSTYVSSVGKYVDQFEEQVKEYTGAKYAIATVNGTAALHMSMILAGVKESDIVLTQPLSFIATCNAISYIGAEPYFIDIDRRSLSMSSDSLTEFLEAQTELTASGCFLRTTGQRISACIPMHTFGFPGEVDLLTEICLRYKIPLIEDAAESIGSLYKGTHTGRFGLLGTFSFNGNKTITCGGGGIIITDDESLGRLGKHLTTQAKVPHRWEFVHDHIGYNYRLPNLNAALACAQLEQLEQFVFDKRSLAKSYSDFFDATAVEFVREIDKSRANYWLNAIICKDKVERDELLTFTNDNGVMTRPVWELMHRLEMFKKCKRSDLPIAEWVADRLVNLPSSVRCK